MTRNLAAACLAFSLILGADCNWAESPDEFNSKGNELLKEQQYKEAIEQYSKALEIDPQFAKSLFNRGYCHYALKEYDQAEENLRASILIDSNDHGAHYWLGKTYLGQKRYLIAAVSFGQAVALKEDPAYLISLAVARHGEQDNTQALAAVERALKIQPENATALTLKKKLEGELVKEKSRQQVKEATKRERLEDEIKATQGAVKRDYKERGAVSGRRPSESATSSNAADRKVDCCYERDGDTHCLPRLKESACETLGGRIVERCDECPITKSPYDIEVTCCLENGRCLMWLSEFACKNRRGSRVVQSCRECSGRDEPDNPGDRRVNCCIKDAVCLRWIESKCKDTRGGREVQSCRECRDEPKPQRTRPQR